MIRKPLSARAVAPTIAMRRPVEQPGDAKVRMTIQMESKLCAVLLQVSSTLMITLPAVCFIAFP